MLQELDETYRDQTEKFNEALNAITTARGRSAVLAARRIAIDLITLRRRIIANMEKIGTVDLQDFSRKAERAEALISSAKDRVLSKYIRAMNSILDRVAGEVLALVKWFDAYEHNRHIH